MICLDKILLWRKHPGKHQTHTVPTAKIANQHPEQQVILSLFASGQGCSFKRGFTLQPHSRKITFHFNISFLSKNAVRQQVNIYKKKKKGQPLWMCKYSVQLFLTQNSLGPRRFEQSDSERKCFQSTNMPYSINVIFLNCYIWRYLIIETLLLSPLYFHCIR